MGEAYNDYDLVFCKEDGSPYTDDDVRSRFRRVLKDVEGITPEEWTTRELRDTFVSVLSDHGLPTEKIGDLVGHSSTRVTDTVYRHELRPEIREGAEHMDDIFKTKKTKSA